MFEQFVLLSACTQRCSSDLGFGRARCATCPCTCMQRASLCPSLLMDKMWLCRVDFPTTSSPTCRDSNSNRQNTLSLPTFTQKAMTRVSLRLEQVLIHKETSLWVCHIYICKYISLICKIRFTWNQNIKCSLQWNVFDMLFPSQLSF